MSSANHKSTTVGIAEDRPRQLAPSVGISRAGFMDSPVPISATGDSSTLAEQIFFGSLEFTPHSPAQRRVFSSLHEGTDLTFGSHRFHINTIRSLQLPEPIFADPTDQASLPDASASSISASSIGSTGESEEVPHKQSSWLGDSHFLL